MFNLNQIVKHKKAGKICKVVGYAHQTFGNTYFLSVIQMLKNLPTKLVMEDVIDEWCFWQQDPQIFWQLQPLNNQISASTKVDTQ